jgi:hypothetical protein
MWTAWEDAQRFDEAFRDVQLSDTQAERVRTELLRNKQLRLKQGFASYVVDSLPGPFWDSEVERFLPNLSMDASGVSTFEGLEAETSLPISRFVPQEATLLRRRLLASYDARSSYVHAGSSRHGLLSTLTQVIDNDAGPKDPIEFVGLRLILRFLILEEMKSRTNGASLPDFTMVE